MGKQKIETRIIGYEKHFDSLSEATVELNEVWPDTNKILKTDIGEAVITYSALAKNDDWLEDQFKLLRAAGRTALLDGYGEELSLARLIGDKGNVSFTTWLGAGFGWRAQKGGGFLVFIETWSNRHFKKEGKIGTAAEVKGWRPRLESLALKSSRYMGDTADLEAMVRAKAKEQIKAMAKADDAKREGKQPKMVAE